MKHIQEPPPRDKCTMSWWAGLCKSGRSYIQVGSQCDQKWMTIIYEYHYYYQYSLSPLRSSRNFSPEMVQVTGVVSMATGSLLCSLSWTHGSPMS